MPFYAQLFRQTNFAHGFVWESANKKEFFEVPVLIKAGRIGNYGEERIFMYFLISSPNRGPDDNQNWLTVGQVCNLPFG